MHPHTPAFLSFIKSVYRDGLRKVLEESFKYLITCSRTGIHVPRADLGAQVDTELPKLDKISISRTYYHNYRLLKNRPARRKSVLMTPTIPCRFLSLPREIRDTIYNLTKTETTILWPWPGGRDADIPLNLTSVSISGLPTSALMCVSAQVRAEYLQITNSWRVSAFCDLDLEDDGWMPAQELADVPLVPITAEALANVHEATVMVRFFSRQIHSRTTAFPTAHIQPLLKALAADAPRLDVLRLVLYQDKEGNDAHWIMFEPGHREQYGAARRNRYFTPAPQNIDGYKLARTGEGYKLHFDRLIPSFQGPGMSLSHVQTRVGVFLYQRLNGEAGELSGGSGERIKDGVDLLTHEVLVAPRMARPYPKEALDLAAKHERYYINRWQDRTEETAEWLEDEERANRWPKEMQEWVEIDQ